MKRIESKKLNLGLKLRSTDVDLQSEAMALYKGQLFQYIELYIKPGSYDEFGNAWGALKIPMIIHAPHSLDGVNLADSRLREKNQRAYEEVRRFSDRVSSSIIIAHGGCDGPIEEVIHQLRLLNDDRIIIENKPLRGLNGEVCRGSSPEEFKRIFDEGVVTGCVLDFGHALCAARSFGTDRMEIVEGFMNFNPMLFHVSDGDTTTEKDVHKNLGKGDLDVKEFFSIIPDNGTVTLETPRETKPGLGDFIEDVSYLKEHLQIGLHLKSSM